MNHTTCHCTESTNSDEPYIHSELANTRWHVARIIAREAYMKELMRETARLRIARRER